MCRIGALCIASVALGLGACASLSGLSSYAPGDCPEGCDGNGDVPLSPLNQSETGADARVGSDAADMIAIEAIVDIAANDAADDPTSDALDGALDVADVQPDSSLAEIATQDTSMDALAEGATDSTTEAALDAGLESGPDAGVDASDGSGGDLGVGLIAYYKFDETSGTTAADSSGNNRTATLVGGAAFSSGLQSNAVSLDGRNAYVSLPSGIVSGLTSFSICAWVNLTGPATTWSRIFDFGTGTTTYMFLTANSNASVPRFSITTMGFAQEQQINPPSALPTGSWQHVAVTWTANTGTLYVGGAKVAQNTGMTLNPSALGTTTQNWLGRSEYMGDPYLSGQIDNFRIYDRALSTADVQALYVGHL